MLACTWIIFDSGVWVLQNVLYRNFKKLKSLWKNINLNHEKCL